MYFYVTSIVTLQYPKMYKEIQYMQQVVQKPFKKTIYTTTKSVQTWNLFMTMHASNVHSLESIEFSNIMIIIPLYGILL